MSEQLSILDKQVLKAVKEKRNLKRRWENGFQKWSDEQVNDDCSPLGKCGYGAICDYCEDNSYGRPCVRALNRMLKEKGWCVDYEVYDFEAVWNDGGARA